MSGQLFRLLFPVLCVFLSFKGIAVRDLFADLTAYSFYQTSRIFDVKTSVHSEPDVRISLYRRNVTMSTKLELIKKIVQKLEDEWVYKQERNQWDKVDDNYYQGEKNEHGQRHGLGVVSLPNGDFYVGEWQYNNRHGYGKTIVGWSFSETTEEYITEWSGIGLYHTGDDLKYEGEWKAGRQDGFGVFAWPDGSRYIGEWMDGKQHGNGIWESSKIIHEGVWKAGERNGLAKLTNKKDGNVLYKNYNKDILVD